MTDENYWSRTLGRRTSRRGAIRTGGLLGAGLAGAALIGCGDDDDAPATPGGTPAPDATATPGDEPGATGPRPGGEIGIYNNNAVQTFNPIEHIGEGQRLSGVHVYDRLLAPKLDERIYVLEAAESVELPDDTTVVFALKDGMVFQDVAPVNGRPVTAHDIVETQMQALASERANNIFQRGSMESVEAPDDHTVVFHLQRPNAYLFSGQGIGHPDTMAIIPVELHDDLNANPPVGSGPYQLGEYQMGVRYVYERNPSYREAGRGLPYIDRRVALVLEDPSTHETAFRGEQVHEFFNPSVDAADRVIRDLGDRINVTEYLAIAAFTWDMNARRTRSGWAETEIFEDARIREAFYRLTNQQQITDLVDNGMAENCPGALPVSLERYLLDWSETEQYHRHDPEEARALLDAAGFDFEQTYRITTTPGARNESGIQILENQLNQVGVRTAIHMVQFSEWLGPIIMEGNYDFSIAQHPAYDTPLQSLRHHHTDPQQRNNSANLADPDVDAMIERSEEILDPDEQVQLVKDIQVELLKRYAHRAHINSFVQRNLTWGYLRDWEVSAAGSQHAKYQLEAWIDA